MPVLMLQSFVNGILKQDDEELHRAGSIALDQLASPKHIFQTQLSDVVLKEIILRKEGIDTSDEYEVMQWEEKRNAFWSAIPRRPEIE